MLNANDESRGGAARRGAQTGEGGSAMTQGPTLLPPSPKTDALLRIPDVEAYAPPVQRQRRPVGM